MGADKLALLSQKTNELAELTAKQAGLYSQLARAYRMKKVWPDCFGETGQAELYTGRLGDGHHVPFTYRYYLERVEDKTRKELTKEEYDFIREG